MIEIPQGKGWFLWITKKSNSQLTTHKEQEAIIVLF